jgi:TrpR-related protein YerC/YecD
MKRKQSIEIAPPQPYTPSSDVEKQLIKAFSMLKTEQEYANFLRDILSPAELEELANRLQIAKLLIERKMSYLEIAEEVGASTTTVTRVSQWLFRGCGGYQNVLEKLGVQAGK